MHSRLSAQLKSRLVTPAYRIVRNKATQQPQSMEGQPRGAFILFEGVDRSGKSTQTAKLAAALQARGDKVQSWNFPDRKGTSTGQAINDYLAGKLEKNDKAIHLMFSANRWEKSDALVQALKSGTTLIVDRYAYSGVAYSAAKAKPGMDVDWCRHPDQGLPAPDLVVYLSVSNKVAAARAGFGGERYEKAEFQDKVRAVFEQLQDDSWLVIDAAQSPEHIHQQVLAEVLQVISRCQEGEPIKQLWDSSKYVDLAAATAASKAAQQVPEQQQQQPLSKSPRIEAEGQAPFIDKL